MLDWSVRRGRYAFVDVETTGVSRARDAVVEVAVLVVEDGRPRHIFETLVNPGRPIPRFATAIHGIADDDVRQAPTLRDVAPFLRAMCNDGVVVAHNASFDMGFLPCLAPRAVLCTWRLSRRLVFDVPNYRNQTLRAYFNVDDPLLAGRRPHRALADAVVTRGVFFGCLDRYLQTGAPDSIGALLTFTAACSAGRTHVTSSVAIAESRSRAPRGTGLIAPIIQRSA